MRILHMGLPLYNFDQLSEFKQESLFSLILKMSTQTTQMRKKKEEKELQSRVGDRPTAIILQVQFHFFIFALFFNAKYSTKICPSQKDQLYLKMEGRQSRPSNLLYIYPFQEGHILVEYFALKNQAKIKKMKLHLQNCSSWSISHS